MEKPPCNFSGNNPHGAVRPLSFTHNIPLGVRLVKVVAVWFHS